MMKKILMISGVVITVAVVGLFLYEMFTVCCGPEQSALEQETDEPEAPEAMDFIETGPMTGTSMLCPDRVEGLAFYDWPKGEVEVANHFISGRSVEALNRRYRCRIDEQTSIVVSPDGEFDSSDGEGVPERYIVSLEKQNEASREMFTASAPLNAYSYSDAFLLTRINQQYLEISWESGGYIISDYPNGIIPQDIDFVNEISSDSDFRGAKIVDLDTGNVALDVNWFGDHFEIWQEGAPYVFDDVIPACDADPDAQAVTVTGITMNDTMLALFEDPLRIQHLSQLGPCPLPFNFKRAVIVADFSEVRIPYTAFRDGGRDTIGTIVFNVEESQSRFEYPDGPVVTATTIDIDTSNWAEFSDKEYGYRFRYPANDYTEPRLKAGDGRLNPPYRRIQNYDPYGSGEDSPGLSDGEYYLEVYLSYEEEIVCSEIGEGTVTIDSAGRGVFITDRPPGGDAGGTGRVLCTNDTLSPLTMGVTEAFRASNPVADAILSTFEFIE